jgi:Mce-associated membrane protein
MPTHPTPIRIPAPRRTPARPRDPVPPPDPDDEVAAEDEPIEAESPEVEPAEAQPRAGWRSVLRLPVLLIVAAVLLAGGGVWLVLDAHGMRASGSARNRALVDTAATAEVNASVTNSLNKIFSYSYDKTEVTEQAAANVLRGRALDAYHQLFGQVRALAPQQKLVLTTRVVSSAVQYLDGDHAQLLVFLDQSATRADNNSTSAAAAQLSVTAKREGDVWVITDLVPR